MCHRDEIAGEWASAWAEGLGLGMGLAWAVESGPAQACRWVAACRSALEGRASGWAGAVGAGYGVPVGPGV